MACPRSDRLSCSVNAAKHRQAGLAWLGAPKIPNNSYSLFNASVRLSNHLADAGVQEEWACACAWAEHVWLPTRLHAPLHAREGGSVGVCSVVRQETELF